LFEYLVREAPQLSAPWLRASFALLFVGYGTKMGLAPMHTWKPDAYGEAPGMVGALLAGGVTN
jgi:hydrogenase-4 component F